MKTMISIACLMLFSAASRAQKTIDKDMEQLKTLNARFIHNFVTNDTASHSKIIHPGFLYISSNGQYVDRKKYLQDWAHGFDGITYWDYRGEDIRIFGNMALVHAQNKCEIVRDGVSVTSWSIYTDTYIKEKGEWKCVQAQITRLAPEHAAGDETIVRKYDYRK
jgi:hypothetical protein